MTDKLPQPKCEVSYHKSENYWISSLTIVEIHKLLKALLELLSSFSTDMDLADHLPQSLEDLEGLEECCSLYLQTLVTKYLRTA